MTQYTNIFHVNCDHTRQVVAKRNLPLDGTRKYKNVCAFYQKALFFL